MFKWFRDIKQAVRKKQLEEHPISQFCSKENIAKEDYCNSFREAFLNGRDPRKSSNEFFDRWEGVLSAEEFGKLREFIEDYHKKIKSGSINPLLK